MVTCGLSTKQTGNRPQNLNLRCLIAWWTRTFSHQAPIHGFEESLLLIKSLNVRLTEFTESIMLFQLGFGNILLSAKSTDRSRVGNPDDPQHDPRPKD